MNELIETALDTITAERDSAYKALDAMIAHSAKKTTLIAQLENRVAELEAQCAS